MRSVATLTIAAALAAFSAPAFAGPDKAATPEEVAMPEEHSAPAADTTATDTSTVVLPTDSPTPADEAYKLQASDPTVTANAPIPDTPENRARFGGPDSRGGKMTRPVGNR